MTRKELYDAIVDGILYYVKKKDALYFNLPISEEETLLISPCSIYSPEQLIEHMYLGDVMDCICHYLVFTENNENNFDAQTIDELLDKLEQYTQEKKKINKKKRELKAYYKKHHLDYDFNEEWYKREYVMLFGYMPGTKFGKSQHESVKVAVDIEFLELTAEMLSKLKQAVKNENFISLYPDCPEITNCDLYEDPDLPYVTIRGTLIDEMLFDELKALETSELKGVSSLQVRME